MIFLIDKFLLLKFEEEFSLNFILYYTLIIIVFTGSINWNLQKKISNIKIIYGFIPSFIAVIIIIFNLNNFDNSLLFLLLIFTLISQLFFDYFLIFKNSKNKYPFYFLRLPLTLFISLSLIIL